MLICCFDLFNEATMSISHLFEYFYSPLLSFPLPSPLLSSIHLSPPSPPVVEAAAGSGLDGGNMALAIFILVLLLSVLLGGAYVYITRLDHTPSHLNIAYLNTLELNILYSIRFKRYIVRDHMETL